MFHSFLLKLQVQFADKKLVFLLNTAFAMEVLDFILRVHPAIFVTRLPKQLKYTTKSSSPYRRCPLD
jgi:hypothetical protein